MLFSPTKLLHYSAVQVHEVHAVEQAPIKDFKPDGFWISVEDGFGWREWCEAENFRKDSLKIVHEVTLSPTANLLWLSTAEEIWGFHREFAEPLSPRIGLYYPNWQRVAERVQGIIIAPYCWELRLSGVGTPSDWYYPWDCSSGCIWDPAAIASILPCRQPGRHGYENSQVEGESNA